MKVNLVTRWLEYKELGGKQAKPSHEFEVDLTAILVHDHRTQNYDTYDPLNAILFNRAKSKSESKSIVYFLF